jgi:hypothetical protein
MTAVTDIAVASSARGQPWRVLFWLAPLTAFWIALNYWVPALPASGVPSTAGRLAIHIAIVLGLWLALERTEFPPRRRLGVWLAIVVPYTLWLAVIWSAAINGVFRPGYSTLPLVPVAIFLPIVVGVPILLRSKRIGEVLDAMPTSWLVGLQVYRILGGIFLVGWARGVIPGLFALPAGIGDVTTGLLALPVAYLLASRNGDALRSAIAWNIFGLADFTIAVGIGLATAPGPFQVIVPSIPNSGVGLYPTVLIPAFAVPSSILLHVLSLRQLRRTARRGPMLHSA